jgi:hypothetical protein
MLLLDILSLTAFSIKCERKKFWKFAKLEEFSHKDDRRNVLR